jgi:hypothetical protein
MSRLVRDAAVCCVRLSFLYLCFMYVLFYVPLRAGGV